MCRIAVVGDLDSIMGFKAIGYSTCAVKDGAEAREAIRNLANEGYAIIFVTESSINGADDFMEEFRGRITPAIIPIPGNRGSMGIGMQRVKKAVERAVGADILKQD
jgi:V/A-type H+-transporting ATPase subunit F